MIRYVLRGLKCAIGKHRAAMFFGYPMFANDYRCELCGEVQMTFDLGLRSSDHAQKIYPQ